ncbi:NB-ARC domain-containing protein [Streptomyces actinomycinicus]|uniref:NB-ARC domain-containing protein n=1 Tax=Streptomyces actinomycinicus TaxID=1695166 RepID=UPI0027DA0B1D|nr:NB-ARC domain-containing protein [Streptomyces actinomycinicus]
MEHREPDESIAEAHGVGGDHVDFRGGTFHGTVIAKVVAGRPPASWPHQVGAIPPSAVCFQNRAEAGRLTAFLARSGTVVITSQPARAGLGPGLSGVGKTQLAAHYARTAWQAGDLDVLVWITATTAQSITTGYAQAASELLGVDPADQRAATTFLAWLEPKAGQRPCRWLVVLDDVADPADLTGLWPPASPTGRTLVTTRRQDAALTTGRHRVPVGVFTPAESLAYLTTALPTHARTDGQLASLAEDLGHLPLALSQAAAYLTDSRTPIADYRQALADRTTALRDTLARDRRPAPTRSALPDADHSVLARDAAEAAEASAKPQPQPPTTPPAPPGFGPPQEPGFEPPHHTPFVPPRPRRPPLSRSPRGPVSRAVRLLLALALIPLTWLMVMPLQSGTESTRLLAGLGLFVAPVLGLWLSCSAVARRSGRLSKAVKIQATVGILVHGTTALTLLIGAMNDLN